MTLIAIAIKIAAVISVLLWAFLYKLSKREQRDVEFRRLKQQHEAALFLKEKGLHAEPDPSDFTQA